VELSVYGLMTGLIMRFVRTGRITVDLYISLAIAMVLGRIAAGIAQAFLLFGGGVAFGMGLWVAGYFYTSLPGIAIQLVFIPSIVIALERGRLIPSRYPNNKNERRTLK